PIYSIRPSIIPFGGLAIAAPASASIPLAGEPLLSTRKWPFIAAAKSTSGTILSSFIPTAHPRSPDLGRHPTRLPSLLDDEDASCELVPAAAFRTGPAWLTSSSYANRPRACIGDVAGRSGSEARAYYR